MSALIPEAGREGAKIVSTTFFSVSLYQMFRWYTIESETNIQILSYEICVLVIYVIKLHIKCAILSTVWQFSAIILPWCHLSS